MIFQGKERGWGEKGGVEKFDEGRNKEISKKLLDYLFNVKRDCSRNLQTS